MVLNSGRGFFGGLAVLFLCVPCYAKRPTQKPPAVSPLITVYYGMDATKKEQINRAVLPKRSPSLHFFLPSIGRRSIFTMLGSLKSQVEPQDFLTVVFDGKDKEGIFELVRTELVTFVCHTNVLFEQENLGFWGHALRNKYNCLPGDFVMHCDDDDTYCEHAISVVRSLCVDKEKLYVFNMIGPSGHRLWSKPGIVLEHIATPVGVIPMQYNACARWTYRYGGDYDFYKGLVSNIGPANVIFVDYPIYHVKHQSFGTLVASMKGR